MKRLAYFFSCALAIAAWLIASWPALQGLFSKWADVGDSYVLGFPLLLAAGWLIYRRRGRLLALAPRPSWFGILLFVASVALIYAARLIQLPIVQQLMLPPSLWCAVFALAGWAAARCLLLPIALQYFGMPVWDFVIGFLQRMTLAVAHTALDWLQIPVRLWRNELHLPDGIIVVADSCSGLNLLLAALLIAVLQVEMGRYDTKRRLALLIVAALIGLLDNWIRVVALIIIAHYSHMQSPLVYSHASFGWWIYAASLVPFFWIAHRLESRSSLTVAGAQRYGDAGQTSLWPGLVVFTVVVVFEYGSTLLISREGSVHSLQVAGVARAVEPEFMPRYSGYDRRQTWVLLSDSDRYELSAFIYTRQQGNKKLIYYGNVIAPASQMEVIDSPSVDLREVNVAIVSGTQPRLVWWFYWIDGAMTSNPLRAKLYQLKAILFGDPSAALILLSQRCVSENCSIDRQRLQDPARQAVLAQMRSVTADSVN